MKRVSIKDIAKELGVGASTVSSVLNGKAKEARISTQLAQKIKKVAEQLGYQPNYAAVTLRTGKSNVIGLIVENISNVFFAALAKAIEDEALKHNYRILYCSTENDDKRAIEMVKMLFHQQVDGFIIAPSSGIKSTIQKLIAAKQPLVLIDRYFPDVAVPSSLVDNASGIEQSVKHLLEKDYRHIAFVTTDVNQIQMKKRAEAFRSIMFQEKMLNEKFMLVIPYGDDHKERVKKITGLIKQNPEIDAIIFSTNYLGIAGLESIREQEKKIPEDLAVICFDDHDVFRLHNPPITSIIQPIDDIAHTAFAILFEQLKKNKVDQQNLVVQHPPRLVVREST